MFKDILLPAITGDLSDATVESACALAEAMEGRIIALVAVSVFVPDASDWIRCWRYTGGTAHTTLRT